MPLEFVFQFRLSKSPRRGLRFPPFWMRRTWYRWKLLTNWVWWRMCQCFTNEWTNTLLLVSLDLVNFNRSSDTLSTVCYRLSFSFFWWLFHFTAGTTYLQPEFFGTCFGGIGCHATLLLTWHLMLAEKWRDLQTILLATEMIRNFKWQPRNPRRSWTDHWDSSTRTRLQSGWWTQTI